MRRCHRPQAEGWPKASNSHWFAQERFAVRPNNHRNTTKLTPALPHKPRRCRTLLHANTALPCHGAPTLSHGGVPGWALENTTADLMMRKTGGGSEPPTTMPPPQCRVDFAMGDFIVTRERPQPSANACLMGVQSSDGNKSAASASMSAMLGKLASPASGIRGAAMCSARLRNPAPRHAHHLSLRSVRSAPPCASQRRERVHRRFPSGA